MEPPLFLVFYPDTQRLRQRCLIRGPHWLANFLPCIYIVHYDHENRTFVYYRHDFDLAHAVDVDYVFLPYDRSPLSFETYLDQACNLIYAEIFLHGKNMRRRNSESTYLTILQRYRNVRRYDHVKELTICQFPHYQQCEPPQIQTIFRLQPYVSSTWDYETNVPNDI